MAFSYSSRLWAIFVALLLALGFLLVPACVLPSSGVIAEESSRAKFDELLNWVCFTDSGAYRQIAQNEDEVASALRSLRIASPAAYAVMVEDFELLGEERVREEEAKSRTTWSYKNHVCEGVRYLVLLVASIRDEPIGDD